MSYCLFTYWVLDQQRRKFIAKQIPVNAKDDMMSKLEDGINRNFLQYCDPIKPLDVFLQLFARLFITSMQMRILHARACAQGSSEERLALLDTATRSLRYFIAIQSQTYLANFRWLTKAWSPWQASELVVAVWSAHRNNLNEDKLREPNFIAELEHKLATYSTDLNQAATRSSLPQSDDQDAVPAEFERISFDEIFDADFNIDLQDIDWNF
ncbi:hypothetical protein EK21DRAFT_98153 [Setomelanomma holmii]|uniref:Uncharacterized protein n=1 Tax=Setomelanomma holmii TaxID=210430 RepID=A0A9P4LQN8_9PLEO|nr:hypothetical protein EK21DRAFT_98153 [Setomelanomma holmii]